MKTPDFSQRLAEVMDRWRQVRQGTLPYGEGTPDEQAKEFQFQEVLPVIIEKARARWEAQPAKPESPDIMITMAGFSPETTIIAYSILRPKHLFVVTSNHAADAGINRIAQFVTNGPCRIAYSQFQWRSCNPTEPYDIYSKVKAFLAEKQLLRADGKPLDAIVDITGGKKVMSAAAALLAWRLSVPLCYIDSEFDDKTRRPVPGSENLIFLNSPVAIYGDEEINTAVQVFNAGHYTQAGGQFASLAERIQEPIFARFMEELSALYRVWCDLELPALDAALARVAARLDDHRVRAQLAARAPDGEEHLHRQIAFMRRVAKDDRPSMLLCFYLLGVHYRERLNRHDFAALFFYRTMEGTLRQRLDDLFPGLTAAREADYSKVGLDLNELLGRFNAQLATLWEGSEARELPTRLMFLNSAALLLAAEDKMLKKAGQDLGSLRELSDLRNLSVLAHGFKSVTDADSRRLKVAAERLLKELFLASGHAVPGDAGFDEACRSLRFLHLSVG